MDQEYFNQRTFNINDIFGDFIFDWRGTLVNRKKQICANGNKDMNGKPANDRGYLINIDGGGYIINKHNMNLMFRKEELTKDGEIPYPYKFERFNFNPHEVMGHFDFDKKSDKPIILKNK